MWRIALLALVACGGNRPAAPTREVSPDIPRVAEVVAPEVETVAPEAQTTAPVATDVSFETADAKTITATLTTGGPAGAPGVVLVHQFHKDRHQWEGYQDALAGAGYLVLAIDLRGHGDSAPQDGELTDLLTDPDQAPLDTRAELAYLAGEAGADPARLAVLGTSIGANLACVMSHEHRVRTAIA